MTRKFLLTTAGKMLAMVSVFVLTGIGLAHMTYAASGSLNFSPSSGSYTVGSSFTVTVVENSGSDAAVSVEADVKYPANLLSFVSDTVVPPFNYNPNTTDTASGGVVKIQRAQLGTSSTGSQTVSVLTFNVIAAGPAQLSFDTGSQISPLNPGPSLMTSSPSSTYTLNLPPPAAPAISSFTANPATVNPGSTSVLSWSSSNVISGGCSIGSAFTGDGSGSWTTPALTATTSYTLLCKNSANATASRSLTVTVNSSTAPPPGGGTGSSSDGNISNDKASSVNVNTVPVKNNGRVNVSANSVTIAPTTIQTEGVQKVEYYLNGKLIDTETKPPYTYQLNTSKLSNGVQQLTTKTYYSNGTTKTTTQNINIKNTAKKVSSSSIGISLVLIAAIIGGVILIQRRRNRFHPGDYAVVGGQEVVSNSNPKTEAVMPQPATPVVPPPANPDAPAPGSVIGHDDHKV